MLDLDGQAGGHGDFAVAEALGGFGDRATFRGGDLTVTGDDAAVKAILCVLIPQEAKPFNALDILGGGDRTRCVHNIPPCPDAVGALCGAPRRYAAAHVKGPHTVFVFIVTGLCGDSNYNLKQAW